VQEGLKNIIKHARTKKAYVSLVGHDETIRLRIDDEGIGFDPTKQKGGLGLASMKERVRAIKGTILIASERGQGTSIAVQVPTQDRR
jgi:signal transduction histidine kinase